MLLAVGVPIVEGFPHLSTCLFGAYAPNCKVSLWEEWVGSLIFGEQQDGLRSHLIPVGALELFPIKTFTNYHPRLQG